MSSEPTLFKKKSPVPICLFSQDNFKAYVNPKNELFLFDPFWCAKLFTEGALLKSV